ncbi:hypothetical protein DY037_07075 [Apilactobacillus micheneri]|uniref:hypothetical protein n=1 Tax=Apilactobacillus micheneri TaxID=1899430 RepID=UPI00112CF1F4|nr:hypothetical protein [Apilactobacillus micheneri]TPR48147.1 hypothetical protein DY037_07075 [Apilactobacillus micheneri]
MCFPGVEETTVFLSRPRTKLIDLFSDETIDGLLSHDNGDISLDPLRYQLESELRLKEMRRDDKERRGFEN